VADKRRELALVHTARKRYPWFPPGESVEAEKPDVVLVDGDHQISIEITELFQRPNAGSNFGPHVVRKCHEHAAAILPTGLIL
jgi:hypothetical protein